MCGSMTPCSAIAAMAASTALPPLRSMSTAASVTAGCEGAAMPRSPTASERPGTMKSRCRQPIPSPPVSCPGVRPRERQSERAGIRADAEQRTMQLVDRAADRADQRGAIAERAELDAGRLAHATLEIRIDPLLQLGSRADAAAQDDEFGIEDRVHGEDR